MKTYTLMNKDDDLMKKILLMLLTTLISIYLVACIPKAQAFDVLFDVNGGFWHKDELATTRPDATVTIRDFDNYLGDNTNFTLFSPTDIGLRWHYKIFIQYNADLETYVVVYSDPYTASVDRLDLPDYDYIIGVHYHNSVIESDPVFINLFTDGVGTPLIFNKDITVPQESVEFKVYPKNPDASSFKLLSNEINELPTPVRPDFDFKGWYVEDNLITKAKDIKLKSGDTMTTLTAHWESYSLESLEALLDNLIPDHVTDSLALPVTYSGYTLTWETSHPLVISTTGKFHAAYEPTTVTLTAHITSLDNTTVIRTFNVTVPNKKPLTLPIASSYIWRNYALVDERFFQTLDIINTAFITADANGNFSGTAQLSDIETYILPKSKIYNNWVVFSVAPESRWSEIAMSATKIENFANNIVDIINTYGFDGVDIDWETPRSGEEVRYSNMMKVIYEKVKANNPNHLVTTAITGGRWQPPMYNLTVSNQYLDFINVMTYSMSSSGGSYQNALHPRSGVHNTEFNAGRTPATATISESVPIFNGYGVPNSKLIFGLAFYGVRQQRTYNTSTNTWSNWAATSPSVFFPEIQSSYLNNPDYLYFFDNEAGVPYLVKKDGTIFISYDNERSIRLKSEYVIEHGLGGLMFWEYGADTSGTLLQQMRTSLNK